MARARGVAPTPWTVLITGANRGIGEAVARRLGREGHRVLLGARDPDAARRVARDIGSHAFALALDVTDRQSVHDAAGWIAREFGVLDGLVNNAGIFAGHGTLAPDRALFDSLMVTNVFGAWLTITEMLAVLQRSARARVVNVSSSTGSIALTAAQGELPGDAERRAAYCCSKAALNMLTVQLAMAMARHPATEHIRIDSVSPGYVATRMNDFGAPTRVEAAAEVVVRALMSDVSSDLCRFVGPDGQLPW